MKLRDHPAKKLLILLAKLSKIHSVIYKAQTVARVQSEHFPASRPANLSFTHRFVISEHIYDNRYKSQHFSEKT